MALGFVQDLRRDAPICPLARGRGDGGCHAHAGEILGFANRWYPLAVATARNR